MSKHHDTLGVSPGASEKDIKSAYRKLALKNHPDHGGDEEEFKKVKESYEILTGKIKDPDQSRRGNPFEGFNPFTSGRGGINFDGMRDFMDDMNRHEARARRPQRPPSDDREIGFSLNLSVDELKTGRTLKLVYQKSEDCKPCSGEGGSGKVTCGRCKGHGQILHVVGVGGMRMQTSTICPHCNGDGETFSAKCGTCHGQGWSSKEHHMLIDFKQKG